MSKEISKFLIYNTPNNEIRVDVYLEDETVWLTQKAMAEMFQTTPQNITIHLKNIYESEELQENATCKDFLQVQEEGTRSVRRSRRFYNLDVIISVGYRVKSHRGTQFRIWATQRLREYIVKATPRWQTNWDKAVKRLFALRRRKLADVTSS